MNAFLKAAYQALASAMRKVLPEPIRARLSAEGFSIRQFMKESAMQVEPGSQVLDAGAGNCPYKDLFAHTRYESADWKDGSTVKHDFLCDLHQVPKPDESYDAILCTQVLQHVEYPQQVVREFHRLLRPGGRLFLTTCQGWPVIQPPYHFYNFTNFGLMSLFRNANLRVAFIRPRGGVFWNLGHRLRELPIYITSQYRHNLPALLCLLPFFVAGTVVFGFCVPLVFHYLDRIDKSRASTLGYACYCVKDAAQDRDS
ncbi:MAG: class I SAM-dependent methyltransferase [Planctomycetota bacterium]|nr:class I SAM-dependent methyltransferase [Planctomycetota bacterium]